MDIRGDDLIVVVIPSGIVDPSRVSVFRKRLLHEIASDQHTPVDRVQLLLGVDYIVETSAGQ